MDSLKQELTEAFEFFGPDAIRRGMRVRGREQERFGDSLNLSCCFVGFMIGEGQNGDFSKFMCSPNHSQPRAKQMASVLSCAYESYGRIVRGGGEYGPVSYGNREKLYTLADAWLEDVKIQSREKVEA